MEDATIIDLYFQRNQQAITETAAKYGGYCSVVASNLLSCPEDTEEIVNDTWLAAWNDIPPSQPNCLRAYLGRLTRNLAVSRFRLFHTKKRYAGMEALLSELEDVVPGGKTPEEELENKELARILRDWVDSLGAEEGQLFVRRYWHGVPVKELAREAGITQNGMTQRLLRLRGNLRARLEQEGVEL
jgi:RNA polymerase sigma-70 factor (ECF subfamily)